MSVTTTTIRRIRPSNIVESFREHLQHKGRAARETARQNELRDLLKDYVIENGEQDENGSFWLDLPEPVVVKVGKKVIEYTALKAQRSLTPGTPTPRPEEAEALLRQKGLWLTPAQEKVLRDLAVALPYAVITVDVDPDAVTGLLFKGLITDKEFEATLPEQVENFSFVPAETK